MGGKALKGVKTKRITTNELIQYSSEIISLIKGDMIKTHIVRFQSDKESHGDIDIICCNNNPQDVRKIIEEKFNPTEIFTNSNCISFDYNQTQIDFIICSEESFSPMRHYYDYGIGMYMGRIAQKMGLKYGQEGLWYNHFFKGQKVGKIMVSKDYPRIFEHLDLDYNKWVEGFDTLEEIFDYVIGSKYFSADQFQLDQLNKINRERNAKRKSYMSFLDYVDGMEPNHSGKVLMEAHKTLIVDRITESFPEANIKFEITKLEYEVTKKKYASLKFNGGMIMEKYGLKGKELGEAILDFKTYVKNEINEDYEYYIITASLENIWEEFYECAVGGGFISE